ncbi:hypothetical protein VNO77_43902 [Canavalia gladiata]|uniref:Uncharacterized protein n=1 Tax=Canavalia gladiata TaxID=3824 RepID=A0AAN9PQG7_CANGL
MLGELAWLLNFKFGSLPCAFKLGAVIFTWSEIFCQLGPGSTLKSDVVGTLPGTWLLVFDQSLLTNSEPKIGPIVIGLEDITSMDQPGLVLSIMHSAPSIILKLVHGHWLTKSGNLEPGIRLAAMPEFVTTT